MWQTVREVLSKNFQHKKVPYQNDAMTDNEVANLFNDHFIAVGSCDGNSVDSPCEQFIASNAANTLF